MLCTSYETGKLIADMYTNTSTVTNTLHSGRTYLITLYNLDPEIVCCYPPTISQYRYIVKRTPKATILWRDTITAGQIRHFCKRWKLLNDEAHSYSWQRQGDVCNNRGDLVEVCHMWLIARFSWNTATSKRKFCGEESKCPGLRIQSSTGSFNL